MSGCCGGGCGTTYTAAIDEETIGPDPEAEAVSYTDCLNDMCGTQITARRFVVRCPGQGICEGVRFSSGLIATHGCGTTRSITTWDDINELMDSLGDNTLEWIDTPDGTTM